MGEKEEENSTEKEFFTNVGIQSFNELLCHMLHQPQRALDSLELKQKQL